MVLAGIALALFVAGLAAAQPAATGSPSIPEARSSAVRTGPLVALAIASGEIVPFPRVAGSSVTAITADGHGGWFVGGSFTSVDGFGCRAIAHILASRSVDRAWCPTLTSGGDPDGDPSVNAIVRRGTHLFVGGLFSRVGGVSRANLAAIDTTSAKALPWTPPRLCYQDSSDNGLCSVAYSWAYPLRMVIHGGALYINGSFSYVSHQARFHYAAIGLAHGRLLRWNPRANTTAEKEPLNAMVATNYALLTAGPFSRIGGAARKGFAALDYVSGRAQALHVSNVTCYAGARNVMVVGHGRIYLSQWFLEHGFGNCRLVAFSEANGRRVRWTPSLPRLREGWDLPMAAIGHTIYAMREDFGPSSTISLERIDAMSGQIIKWERPLFDDEVTVVAPAGKVVLVGGDFSEVG